MDSCIGGMEKVQSPIKWIGGKSNLSKKIVRMMPKHHTYVEPFGGVGWVLFKKDKSKVEILNDINGELINFYRVIKTLPDEFCTEFELLPKSRELFNDYVAEDISKLTELDRAVRFYYLLMLNFGGRFNRFTFSIRNDGIKQINFDKLPMNIRMAHKRLQDVYIENSSYEEIIRKWDKKDTLFFLDPPYLDTTEKDYTEIFIKEDYERLYINLKDIKGKFILTVADTDFVRELFKDFILNDTDVFYSISKEKKRDHKELNISNFDEKKEKVKGLW